MLTKTRVDQQSTPLSELRLANEAPPEAEVPVVRKAHDPASDAALRENIKAIGLVVPLVVKDYGEHMYVVAGNRRLAALREIYGADSDTTVPTIDQAELGGTPAEVALADNIIRSALHPVDKFEAFAALVASGQEVDDIAARFSVRPIEVRQSLAIAKLAPEIRQAWRAGKISAAAAQTFTLDADQKRQVQVFKKLGNHKFTDWEVRRHLVGDGEDHEGLLSLVTVEAYERAGGRALIDLFGERHAVSNPALLKRLADEKIEAECTRLVQQEGWQFAIHGKPAEARWTWSTERKEGKLDKDEKARTAELNKLIKAIEDDADNDTLSEAEEERIEGYRTEVEAIKLAAEARAYSSDERKRLGCTIEVRGGRLITSYGWKRPRKDAEKAETTGKDSESATPADRKKSQAKKLKAAERGEVTKALNADLEMWRLDAVKEALKLTAEKWTKNADPLPAVLAGIMSSLIEPNARWNRAVDDKMIDRIVEAADEATLVACCRKHFSPTTYFNRLPAMHTQVACREMKVPDTGKTADVKGRAILEAKARGWLPVRLRTPGYALRIGGAAAKTKKHAR